MAGFHLANKRCTMKTLFSPTLYDEKAMIGASYERLSTTFTKLSNVEEDVATSLGYDKKVQYPDDKSVRYYRHFKTTTQVWQCERLCMRFHGTLPIFHTKEHVEYLQNDGYILTNSDNIAIGLKSYQKEPMIMSMWLDGSFAYNGTASDYYVCSDDLGMKPAGEYHFGFYKG